MSVIIETSLGDIVIDLYYKLCPLASRNFIGLCHHKFYNGAIFTDVQRDYLTQIKTEKVSSIYEIENGKENLYFSDEIQHSLTHHRIGVVATSNLAPNLNTSDFYMTLNSEPLLNLDRRHTIFGQVQEGFDALQKINDAFTDETNRPYHNIRIKHTIVLDDPFDDFKTNLFPLSSPLGLEYFKDRLEYDGLDKQMEAKTEEEIINATKKREAQKRAIVLEMLEDIPDADVKPPENILFVCKLNSITQERDLELIFSRFGTLKSVDIVRDWKTNQSLQYAFIEFETEESCQEAYFKMENALIDERRIHVDFCQSVAKQWNAHRFNTKKHKYICQSLRQVTGDEDEKNKFELKKTYQQREDNRYNLIFEQKRLQQQAREEQGADHKYTQPQRETPIEDGQTRRGGDGISQHPVNNIKNSLSKGVKRRDRSRERSFSHEHRWNDRNRRQLEQNDDKKQQRDYHHSDRKRRDSSRSNSHNKSHKHKASQMQDPYDRSKHYNESKHRGRAEYLR